MPGATFNSSIQLKSKLRTSRLLPFCFYLHSGIPQGKGREGGLGFSEPPERSCKSSLGEGVVRVFNGKAPLEPARASVWGGGSEGKGGVGVRFSFSDVVLAILVKFTLSLLIAA